MFKFAYLRYFTPKVDSSGNDTKSKLKLTLVSIIIIIIRDDVLATEATHLAFVSYSSPAFQEILTKPSPFHPLHISRCHLFDFICVSSNLFFCGVSSSNPPTPLFPSVSEKALFQINVWIAASPSPRSDSWCIMYDTHGSTHSVLSVSYAALHCAEMRRWEVCWQQHRR